MKNSIAVFILSLLVCAGSAIAWPWGNVGLNVADPQEQLHVGGSIRVEGGYVESDAGFISSRGLNFTENYHVEYIESTRAILTNRSYIGTLLAAVYDTTDDSMRFIVYDDGRILLRTFGDEQRTNLITVGYIDFTMVDQ